MERGGASADIPDLKCGSVELGAVELRGGS